MQRRKTFCALGASHGMREPFAPHVMHEWRFAMSYRLFVTGTALAISLCAPSLHAAEDCQDVHGKLSEIVVVAPFGSPNDPLGRNVLRSEGTIDAIGTSIFTSVGPGPAFATLAATTNHVFVVDEQDQLTATGVSILT